MRLTVVEDMEALRRHAPAWSALLSDSRANEITLTPTWLSTWWEVFGGSGGRRLRAGLFFEGERLVGLAPLLARRARHRLIPFRRLELLASGEDEADEICSDYISVVARAGAEAEVADELSRALVDGALGPWDELMLPGMAGDGPLPELMRRALRRRGLLVELETTTSCFYIPLPKTFDAYLAALPGRHRYDVRKALRELEAWAGGPVELRAVASAADLPRATAILESLHGERWGHKGVFGSPRFARFHRLIMPELLRRDALELLWIEARGRPVAALYNFVWNGKVSFYQSGRTLDVPARLKLGKAIHAQAIRRAIALGRREYDFLAGASGYKKQLALAARPLVTLRAGRRTLREVGRVLIDAGADRLRALRARAAAAPSDREGDEV